MNSTHKLLIPGQHLFILNTSNSHPFHFMPELSPRFPIYLLLLSPVTFPYPASLAAAAWVLPEIGIPALISTPSRADISIPTRVPASNKGLPAIRILSCASVSDGSRTLHWIQGWWILVSATAGMIQSFPMLPAPGKEGRGGGALKRLRLEDSCLVATFSVNHTGSLYSSS